MPHVSPEPPTALPHTIGNAVKMDKRGSQQGDVVEYEQVADELYGLPPSQFTPARNTAAERARVAGDRKLADRIRRLRRPTTAAWLANLLTREYPDETGVLLQLGRGLREAR